MSNPKHPVGRLPRRVYRRRRLALLAVLIVLVAIVVAVLVAVRRGTDASTGAAAHTPTATTRATTAPASPKPTSTTSWPKPTSTAAATPQDCASSVVDIQAITDASSYAAGVMPKLSFSITNTGTQPCVFDVGTAKQVFTITSGTQTYWTSTDCQTDPQNTIVLLEPDKTLTSATITWDRTESSPSTCTSTHRPAVPAGGAAYHLTVTVDGVASQGYTQFLLH